jgi:hypothetical protein
MSGIPLAAVHQFCVGSRLGILCVKLASEQARTPFVSLADLLLTLQLAANTQNVLN